MIVTFFSTRTATRKAHSRAEQERQHREMEGRLKLERRERGDLEKELQFLEKLHEKQNAREQLTESGLNLLGFLAFWLVGAAIFAALEVSDISLIPRT
jgi:potassium channel subfamily K, other eukaryote